MTPSLAKVLIKLAFVRDSRELWGPWMPKWFFLPFSRPHTLFLTFSIYFFVSLPASSSLNHRLSHCFSSFIPLVSLQTSHAAFTKQDRRYIWSFVFPEIFNDEAGERRFCSLTINKHHICCRFGLLLWNVGANMMCSAYMLLCHLMPHRTDSDCMRLLKIN